MLFTSMLSCVSQRLKETAASLKIRPEGFPEILKELGFGDGERLGTIGDGGEWCSGFVPPLHLIGKQASVDRLMCTLSVE